MRLRLYGRGLFSVIITRLYAASFLREALFLLYYKHSTLLDTSRRVFLFTKGGGHFDLPLYVQNQRAAYYCLNIGRPFLVYSEIIKSVLAPANDMHQALLLT